MEIIEKGNFELSVRRIVLQARHLHYGHDWANDKSGKWFFNGFSYLCQKTSTFLKLKDFKSGLRENEIMGPIASQLDKPQMKLLLQNFYSGTEIFKFTIGN